MPARECPHLSCTITYMHWWASVHETGTPHAHGTGCNPFNGDAAVRLVDITHPKKMSEQNGFV